CLFGARFRLFSPCFSLLNPRFIASYARMLGIFFHSTSITINRETLRALWGVTRTSVRVSLFRRVWLSPSPPHACGGEGWGEEVPSCNTPLPFPLPAPRGEGTSSNDFKGICQKVS